MFCELSEYGFIFLWLVMSAVGAVSVLVMSGIVFTLYYVNPTYNSWIYKSNPTFPSPMIVRKEIIQSLKGVGVGVLCPVFTIYASSRAKFGLQGYCGDPRSIGVVGHLWQTLIIIAFTDFIEYAYHWLGHRFHFMWDVHKHHHVFYNPSPFAVIADEWMDQFIRSMPMVILPWIMPINIDLLFLIFGTLFYAYGVYLHWGFESPLLSAHNKVFNTSYHHYTHHASSVIGKVVYTGFFIKLWDNIFQTLPSTPCKCVECRPKRSKDDFEKSIKPDYSILLSPAFWLKAFTDVTE